MSQPDLKSTFLLLFALVSLNLAGCTPPEETTSSDSTAAKTVEVKGKSPETKPKKKEKPAPYQPAPGFKFKGKDPFRK